MKKSCLALNVHLPRLNRAVIAALALCMGVTASSAAEPPPLGHELNVVEAMPEAPDFTLADMDGGQHSLSDFRGRTVMLNFWGTWCPPCVREMPSMERLYRKYKDRGFTVVAVNQFESEDLVFEFTGRLSIEPTFPILFDKESRASELYLVKGLPTTFLIDKAGRVRYRAMGGREFDHPEVEKVIESLLN